MGWAFQRRSWRAVGLGAALFATLLVGGCGSDGGAPPTAIAADTAAAPAAAMPNYQVGQTFIYSDRRVRRVAGMEDGTLRWQNLSGRESLARPNFIVPTLRRETALRIVSYRVFGAPDDLWPLAVGKSVRFSVARTTVRKTDDSRKTVARTWRCEVAGTQRVTVPAGTFDTYRIECERQSGRRDTVKRRVTWYYAPALGHYVRRDEQRLRDHRVRSVELVASLDKEEATAERIKAVRRSLRRQAVDMRAAARQTQRSSQEGSQ